MNDLINIDDFGVMPMPADDDIRVLELILKGVVTVAEVIIEILRIVW